MNLNLKIGLPVIIVLCLLIGPNIVSAQRIGAKASSKIEGEIPLLTIKANRGYEYEATITVTNTGDTATFDVTTSICDPGKEVTGIGECDGSWTGVIQDLEKWMPCENGEFTGLGNSQCLKKVTIKPGNSKDVTFKITVPSAADAGTYQFGGWVTHPAISGSLATMTKDFHVGTVGATASLTIVEIGMAAASLLGYLGGLSLLAL